MTGPLLHSKPILENFSERSPQPPHNRSETEGVPEVDKQDISSGAILRTSDNVKSPRGPQGEESPSIPLGSKEAGGVTLLDLPPATGLG